MSLRGLLMVDTFRGRVRIRAWPRKRGPSKSVPVQAQNAWFKLVNQMAKFADPAQQKIAIESAKGTGLYPRDLLVRTMSGGMIDIITAEGRLIQRKRITIEDVMFQGAILELTSTQTIPAVATTTLIWPLPVLDTGGFWDVSQPTRLTIPVGVEVVEFTMGWRAAFNTGFQKTILRLKLNGKFITRDSRGSENRPGTTGSRGAIPVVPGDFFELTVFVNITTTVDIDHTTFFTLNVLQAQ